MNRHAFDNANAELTSISNVSFMFQMFLALIDWSRSLVEKSTYFGNDEMVTQFFFSFLLGRFSENLRRKWTSEIVNVIVKRQLDSNFHGLYSYRPKKWRKNVQNFAVKPLACGYIVVLLEFWTYWRHSMVDKSTAHGKIIVVDFSSRFWYVQHYMAGKPNQSCH